MKKVLEIEFVIELGRDIMFSLEGRMFILVYWGVCEICFGKCNY